MEKEQKNSNKYSDLNGMSQHIQASVQIFWKQDHYISGLN
jgi:hypothetical protein